MGKKLPEVTLTSPAPIERAPEVNLFDITGAKAAVIHEIAISDMSNSTSENPKIFLNFFIFSPFGFFVLCVLIMSELIIDLLFRTLYEHEYH